MVRFVVGYEAMGVEMAIVEGEIGPSYKSYSGKSSRIVFTQSTRCSNRAQSEGRATSSTFMMQEPNLVHNLTE